MQRRDVDEPLVAAAPEIERQVAQRLDVAAVHQCVDPAQALPARRVREALLERIGSPPLTVTPSRIGFAAIASQIRSVHSAVSGSPPSGSWLCGLWHPGQRCAHPAK